MHDTNQNGSSHWSNAPQEVETAVLKNTQVKADSQNQILNALIEHQISFNSIADFGCGRGRWLLAAQQMGITDYRGYDIPEIDVSDRFFPAENYHPADLSEPIEADRRFDLVVSAEVAEHIPVNGVRTFIKNLCGFADTILFTAAPPYQGGLGHCNENWMEYWVSLFRDNDFDAYDFLRDKLWNKPQIAYYYRQNVMVFASRSKREQMNAIGLQPSPYPKTLIHPEMYLKAVNRALPDHRAQLQRDIDILYSHIGAFESNTPVQDHDHGYGREALYFRDLAPEQPKAEQLGIIQSAKSLVKAILKKLHLR